MILKNELFISFRDKYSYWCQSSLYLDRNRYFGWKCPNFVKEYRNSGNNLPCYAPKHNFVEIMSSFGYENQYFV